MPVQRITSQENPNIREAFRVRLRRKQEKGRLLIEGPHLIEMALASGATVEKVFFTRGFSEKAEGQRLILSLSEKIGLVYEVTPQLLKKLASTETPQGVVSIVAVNQPSLAQLTAEETSLFVVVDGVQDPGNLGALIRTSDAVGADAVILLPDTCDPFLPKVVRATAGSIFNIPVFSAAREEFLLWLGRTPARLIVTAADSEVSVFDAGLAGPLAIVFGNEAAGVSTPLRDSADLSVKIPIFGRAESLNVAASSAVCLYEILRQRRTAG